MELKKLLFDLSAAIGVSGEETGVGQVAADYLRPFCREIHQDHNGNLLASLGGERGKKILLDAHLDEIGLIVTDITEEGFVKFDKCGGVDVRPLPAADVTVHTASGDLPGVVCAIPPHLKGLENPDEFPKLTDLSIDVGYNGEEAKKRISLGDRITVEREPTELLGGMFTGKALDNRAGVAAVVRAAELLAGEKLGCRVQLLISSQEELGLRGAKTGAYSLDPDEAIVVDVSFAKTPDSPDHKCGEIEKGPMIGYAPILSGEMFSKMVEICREKEYPYQLEVMGGTTGTNADAISVSRKGVRCALLSIPQKYMHSPIEIVSLSDIEQTARLICDYIKKEGGIGDAL